MAKEYEWSAALTVESGGYVGEAISIEQNGVVLFEGAVDSPPQTIGTGWTRTSTLSGSGTYTYTYRDSDLTQNAHSTKVWVTVRDEWTVSFDSRNYMTVNVDTTLVSADRTVVGSISNVDRHIWMRRYAGGPNYLDILDNASTAHTIASNINLGSYSFVLAPGENATRASIYWRNTSHGYEDLPIPNIYTDILGVGIHFRNILPKDYRPGTSLDTNTGVWKSHNRENGACHVLKNGVWQECRTVGGDEGGQGNPPLMLRSPNANSWYNQRLLGKG